MHSAAENIGILSERKLFCGEIGIIHPENGWASKIKKMRYVQ